MDINQFIQSLNQKGIFLYVFEGKLKARVAGELTEEIKAEISKHKNALISYLSAFKGNNVVTSIPPREPSRPAPLSFSQQAIWLVDEVQDESLQYNMPVMVNIRGELHIEALQWALNEVVRRHESLRTGVIVQEGIPVQKIRPYEAQPLAVVDLSGLTTADKEREVERAARHELLTPFDLKHDNLLRSRLLRLDAREFVLLQTMHHISSDGWSISLLTQELNVLYRRFISGNRTSLPGLEVHYADYAQWQRDELQGEKLDKLLGYWNKAMAGAPEVHSLPLDRPRLVAQTFNGAVVKSHFSARETRALKELCQQQDATLFMGLHALVSVLVSLLSNDDEVVIGTPVANRDHHQLSDIIGLFINTLVLRNKVTPEMTFSQVLAGSRATILGSLEHQQLPFELLLDALNVDRTAGFSPLFQIMLVLQNNTQPVLELPGVEIEATQSSAITAKYDLTIYVTEDEDHLGLVWEYNSDIFDAGTIRRLSEALANILDSAVNKLQQPVAALSLVSDSAQRALLDDNGGITNNERDEGNLIALLKEQAKLAPDATALVYRQQEISYAELDRLSTCLARQLTQTGLTVGSRVGINMPRSLEAVIGILAVLKIAGAYVPLDPGYPAHRLSYMVEDANIELVLTAAGQKEMPLDHDRKKLIVDIAALAREQSACEPLLQVHSQAESVTYITYTSGSTGKPKGVKGTQRGVLNRLYWMWQKLPFETDEICCQKTSLNFVDHVWELFGPLLKGVPLVLVDEETARDPSRLVDTLISHNVTRLVLVPSLLQAILDLPDHELAPLKSVVHWTSSGEELAVELVHRFYTQFEHAVLLNLYGSSEVAADATWYDTRELPAGAGSVPIGHPIANTQLYVMNDNLQLLPRGCVGGLYVGGAGIAAGYTRTGQTQERFVNASCVTDVLFNTGDQVRWNNDGTLAFVGRADYQVKVRSYRIELGEIESVLVSLSGIRQAVVIDRYFQESFYLAAYIVPEPAVDIDTDSLRHSLASLLPDYMIPATITVLSEVPLTPNGKLDRRTLPISDFIDADNYVAPRNELETQLCHIWQEVLGLERVGIHDNYYRIGGNSIGAVKLVSSINRILALNVQLKDLFELKTVAGLAGLKSSDKNREVSTISSRANNKKIKNVMEL